MRPVLIGMAHVATIVKSLHAIGHYRGNIDRKVEPTPDITRMDFLRPQNLRRRRRNTRIGIGDGWEAYGSGRPVDDVQRRFVFDLKEDEIRKRKIMEQHQLASRKELENDPEDEDGGK
ncbi:unnamed protein product [Amoebophrya sp. A25]|nr:unnamed protein product [Amoebophrya sp. A25]|eukprot:GSA25T00010794001.1